MGKLIGRVLATEKYPTTMDKFCFWTDQDLRLAAFDVIKVEHINGSFTFGVVENISHITDAQSFLTNYISSDFGDVNVEEPTLRVGMNYVEAKVSFNDSNWYTPVHNNAKVYLATEEEITFALGLRGIKNPLVCGSLKMYEGTQDEVNLPVHLNSKFILGPEGAHLNISGISGLASKTSYAMFLMKAIQDQHINDADENDDDSVAFVIFNVKGKDLMAIDQANEFLDEEDGTREKVLAEYDALGLSTEPFKHVRYLIPYSDKGRAKRSTYLDRDEEESYVRRKCLKKYKFIYGEDKESIEMMFANIDDTTMTMDSIISKVLDCDDSDFKGIETWGEFEDKLAELRAGGRKKDGSITVQSWKKFSRVFHKAIQDDMFANRVNYERAECRLAEELKQIGNNDVYVIDVAKLGEDKQAFVFGDVIRTIYNLKLGEFDDEDSVKPPARIVVFIDELNKYASKDSPKTSPIMRQILDVTERGRSLGVVLFAAEQFRSNINDRVTGNCATHAYGRTNSIETETKDYKSLPSTYRNMLTRLEQGDYLIQNPVFRTLLKIRFPKPIYKQFKQ
ncbi:ATP-binding protein [Xiamenia xianingshaonis]|uniref:ATP-binding protein n=1 Tax=Xiamenia xianingshaonis TaxID=2682776 RepID=A0A9E6SV62_9ACTN|nr:ATP-binding protein [Xiamenia xianingshaonis]NHM14478.1 ATP-binding protein [Xiamenia xianingshaonis]QTU84952.1 ATP-binding protein [Xiamenia xianingshaonis]